jgi:glycosyltransferase involved in cell wall biosynthesis
MIKATEAAGVQRVTDPRKSYDFAVHVCTMANFKAIANRRNVLFTTCEAIQLDLPDHARCNQVDQADLIIVPTDFTRKQVEKFYTPPVQCCQEGVDAETFSYVERTEPGPEERFYYLWVGATDARKGIGYVWNAWVHLQKTGRLLHNAWLILKTTPEVPGVQGAVQRIDSTRVIVDTRKLPVASLAKLYHMAHCLVFPTRGESWGLVLSEAMSTGLPAIWTHHSAMVDWTDPKTGYPLTDLKMVDGESTAREGIKLDLTQFRPAVKGPVKPHRFMGNTLVPKISIEELADKMRYVHDNYAEALERGKMASERMHNQYTWDQAAQRFIEILRQYGGGGD